MIRVVALIVALCGSHLLSSQITKGTRMIGGSIGGSYSVSKGGIPEDNLRTKRTSFSGSLSPGLGFLISDHIAVGANVSVGRSKLMQEEASRNSYSALETFSTQVGIGPFVRYYLKDAFFGEVSAGYLYTWDNIKNTFGTYPFRATSYSMDESDTYYVKAGLGYNYFLNEFVALEGMLSYGYHRQQSKNTNRESTNNEVFFSVGIQEFIARNQENQ